MKTMELLYRLCRWTLGGIFIYAGGTKLLEPEIFAVLIEAYGIVPEGLPCLLHVISPGHQNRAKLDYIQHLGCGRVAAIGNGENVALMLKEAVVGIGILQAEGVSTAALQAAAVVCTSIRDALDLFIKPARLKATLRN